MGSSGHGRCPWGSERGGRCRRGLAVVVLSVALMLVLAIPAGATSATSWGFVCSQDSRWVRANWPTIRTDTDALTPVYFRAFLDRYSSRRWRRVATTRWYIGVSDRFGRHQIDSSLGVLPEPFVGVLGHLFAYATSHGSYAGPQLGPFFSDLRAGYYRTREQYSVDGSRWKAHTTVNGTDRTFCWV